MKVRSYFVLFCFFRKKNKQCVIKLTNLIDTHLSAFVLHCLFHFSDPKKKTGLEISLSGLKFNSFIFILFLFFWPFSFVILTHACNRN